MECCTGSSYITHKYIQHNRNIMHTAYVISINNRIFAHIYSMSIHSTQHLTKMKKKLIKFFCTPATTGYNDDLRIDKKILNVNDDTNRKYYSDGKNYNNHTSNFQLSSL